MIQSELKCIHFNTNIASNSTFSNVNIYTGIKWIDSLIIYYCLFDYETLIVIDMTLTLPDEMADLMKDMKTLVEQTYALNNSSRVILMGHSMGCPVLLYFLNQQTQAWKDKYVKSLVTLAGPWGGAVKTMRLMASGGLWSSFSGHSGWTLGWGGQDHASDGVRWVMVFLLWSLWLDPGVGRSRPCVWWRQVGGDSWSSGPIFCKLIIILLTDVTYFVSFYFDIFHNFIIFKLNFRVPRYPVLTCNADPPCATTVCHPSRLHPRVNTRNTVCFRW